MTRGLIETEEQLRANLRPGVVFPSEEQIQHAMIKVEEDFDEAGLPVTEDHLRKQAIGVLLIALNMHMVPQ